ncbi:hypothetical protein FB45DRAFT_914911 [Roridomyces roridus]|uniref:Uncharacterized protein n=1 Tax=Roridomyces roridus TaxID=1738132 RepID=A0AAD7BT21_9AGAR|nr:hypothetical protein FB45DRAFT_914911 [Roridomyces roridus]
MSLTTALLALSLSSLVSAHIGAWHHGMYCLNGTTPGKDDSDGTDIVQPLWNLTKDDWWFHHDNGCDEFPPDDGDFLEIPANGQFTVELSVNRAFTTLSYGGSRIGLYPDGQNYPDGLGGQNCITQLNIHTQNQSMAAGTAFAISYQSDLSQVTPENLVVFSTLYHTPWERLATYSVPDLPACPEGGCHCAWGWVPNGCGEPNMYMQGFRCMVTGQTGSRALAPAVPPTWCQDDPGNCTTGAKQMIYWNQLDGNNILVEGWDDSGEPRSPAYNGVCGWEEGAQTDIFLSDGSATPTSVIGTATGVGPGPSATGTPAPSGKPSGARRMSVSWTWGLVVGIALVVGWVV